MKIIEINLLLEINKKWESFFKGDLLEDIFEKYKDINLFIEVLLKDWIPCWKSENKEGIELYDSISLEVDKLDKNIIQKEYKIIRELYLYQKELNNPSFVTLKDIINWIDTTLYDENEEGEITLELLKNTLDEHIFHYGIDS